MSASDWPDWLRPDPRNNFPAAFRLIVSAITGAGLALSFTWLYFPVYAWISIGLLLMMVFGVKPRVAFFCGFFHAIAFVFASVPWIAEVLSVHGGMSRAAVWGVLLLIAMVWGVLTGGFAWNVEAALLRRISVAGVAAPVLSGPVAFAPGYPPAIRLSS